MTDIEVIKEKLCRHRNRLEVLDIEYKDINNKILKLENELEFLEFAQVNENE